jgi:hypothetical protein
MKVDQKPFLFVRQKMLRRRAPPPQSRRSSIVLGAVLLFGLLWCVLLFVVIPFLFFGFNNTTTRFCTEDTCTNYGNEINTIQQEIDMMCTKDMCEMILNHTAICPNVTCNELLQLINETETLKNSTCPLDVCEALQNMTQGCSGINCTLLNQTIVQTQVNTENITTIFGLLDGFCPLNVCEALQNSTGGCPGVNCTLLNMTIAQTQANTENITTIFELLNNTCPLDVCQSLQNSTFGCPGVNCSAIDDLLAEQKTFGSFFMELPEGNETKATIVIDTTQTWVELNSTNLPRALPEFAENVATFATGYTISKSGVYSFRWKAAVDCETGQSCTMRVGLTLNHTTVVHQSSISFDSLDSDQLVDSSLIDFINLSVGDVVTVSIANWQNNKDIYIFSIYSTIQWISPPATPLNSKRRLRREI